MKIAERVYFACQEDIPSGSLLSEFGFAESHKIAGLQIADFVAYYALQMKRDMLEHRDNLVDKLWWPMEQLMAIFIPEFEYFVAPQLWEMFPLRDYSVEEL